MGILDRIVKATSEITGQVASAGRDLTRKITGSVPEEEPVAAWTEDVDMPENETAEYRSHDLSADTEEDETDDEIVFLTETSEEEAPDAMPGRSEGPEIKGTPVYGDADGLYSLENNFITNRQRRRSWDD